jgi:hypothetical protein
LILPLLLAALAGVAAEPGPSPAEAIAIGSTTVTLQAGPDADVAGQVRRVLPRAVRAAARWGAVPASVTVSVHANHAGLEAATGRTGSPWMRAWAGIGSVDLQSPRSWSQGQASDEALFQILAHELTHCVLFQAVGRDGRARQIPMWFQEGMATVTAGEHHGQVDAAALSSPAAVLRSNPRAVYGTADRAFRDLLQRFGDASVRLLLSRLVEGQAFPAAFQEATGVTLAAFEGDLARRLSAVAVANEPPGAARSGGGVPAPGVR